MTNNVFTLDAMRSDARKRYESVFIGITEGVTVELKPLLKLGKSDRDAIADALGEFSDLPDLGDEDDDDEDIAEYSGLVCDILAKVFRLIAVAPRKLLSALDEEEDPRVRVEIYTQVLKVWMRETQVGEAVSSPI